MNKVIFKHPIAMHGITSLLLPVGFQPLSLQLQFGIPCLWILRPAGLDVSRQHVFVTAYVTGHAGSIDGEYLGTLQFDGGAFIAHYFYTLGAIV